MQIIAKSTQDNVVFVKDGPVTYPVLTDALLNTVMFPELIKSGYKVSAISDTLVKDGVTYKDLPVDTTPITDAQLEQLYNSIGIRVSNEVLNEHRVSPDAATIMAVPPTTYKYNTRAEFIAYLKSLHVFRETDDVMPINSFVAPAALFSIEEFLAPQNEGYRIAMEQRRALTAKQFRTLCRRLNVSSEANASEVVKQYMAWGIDGLRFTGLTASTQQTKQTVRAEYDGMHYSAFVDTIGFIDANGNTVVPPELMKNGVGEWKVPLHVQMASKVLEGNAIAVGRFTHNAVCEVTTVSCGSYTYQYDLNDIVITTDHSKYAFKAIQYVNPYVGAQSIAEVMPKNADKHRDNMHALAIAAELKAKRRQGDKEVTSFNTLLEVGLDPAHALMYMADKLMYTANYPHDADVPVIAYEDCLAYVREDIDSSSPVYEPLHEMATGGYNIDQIAAAENKIVNDLVSDVADKILVAHYFLGKSFDEIYEACMSARTGHPITLSNERWSVTIDNSSLAIMGSAHNKDFDAYRNKAAEEGLNAINVTAVYREVGDNNATRHIAVEFDYIDIGDHSVRMLIDKIAEEITTCAEEEVREPNVRAAITKNATRLAVSTLFDILYKNCVVLRNHINIPGKQPYEMISREATVTERNIVLNAYEHHYDSTVAIAKNSMFPRGQAKIDPTVGNPEMATPSDWVFNNYYVNAVITPCKVIPLRQTELPEYSFMLSWAKSVSANAVPILKQNGIIDDSWKWHESSYPYEKFLSLEDEPTGIVGSLDLYNKTSQDFVQEISKGRLIYTSCPHPACAVYPAFYKEEEPTEADTFKLFEFHLGYKRMINRAIVVDEVDFLPVDVESTRAIRPFEFTHAMYSIVDNPEDLLPDYKFSDYTKHCVVTGDVVVTGFRPEPYSVEELGELQNAGATVKKVFQNVYSIYDGHSYYMAEE